MAKAPKQHQKVGEEYLAATKPGQVARHVFPFPASMVWASLIDADAWTHWLPITKVTWTSPEPMGVGTTRTVEIGKAIVEEVFFGWEDGRRMAFRFDASTLPIKAAVEDYRIEDHADGCELIWTGRATGPIIIGGLVSKQLTKGIRDGLPKLEALIASDPKRFGG